MMDDDDFDGRVVALKEEMMGLLVGKPMSVVVWAMIELMMEQVTSCEQTAMILKLMDEFGCPVCDGRDGATMQ